MARPCLWLRIWHLGLWIGTLHAWQPTGFLSSPQKRPTTKRSLAFSTWSPPLPTDDSWESYRRGDNDSSSPSAENSLPPNLAFRDGTAPSEQASHSPSQATLAQTWQRRTRKSPSRALSLPRYRVFCDLDGVLVDFESGIRELFPDQSWGNENFNVDDLHRGNMWSRVASAPSFFEHLPWTQEGRLLWHAIQPLKPDILTGVPIHRSSRIEKLRWCERELGVPVSHHDRAGPWRSHLPSIGLTAHPYSSVDQRVCRVITCWSANKHHESGKDAVLIDDRHCLKKPWEDAGGIFIHHRNVHETLHQLQERGIFDAVV